MPNSSEMNRERKLSQTLVMAKKCSSQKSENGIFHDKPSSYWGYPHFYSHVLVGPTTGPDPGSANPGPVPPPFPFRAPVSLTDRADHRNLMDTLWLWLTVCHGKIHPFSRTVNHLFLWAWLLGLWYPLVMTNSLPWKIHPFLRTVNHLFLWAWLLGLWYPLVMTNSLPWKDPPIFKNGKPSISMGMTAGFMVPSGYD